MKKFKDSLSIFFILGLLISGFSINAAAQRRNDREIRDIVRSLNSKIDDFQYTLDYQLNSSSNDRNTVDDAKQSLKNLQDKVAAFDDNFNQRRENRDDVRDIITAAQDMDGFLNSNRQNRKIENDWASLRALIDRLATNYGVTPDWNSRATSYPSPSRDNYPLSTPTTGRLSSGLTGTYNLDPSKSERTDQIISETNVGDANRQDLQQKLEAPEQIAIDIRGNQVTLASSKASPITFYADGREKTDTDANGRTIRVRATLRGQELTVSSLGGDTDYTIIFTSQAGGRSMKVTRRITTDYLRQTVFADSVYDKTDGVARLGIDSGAPDAGGYSSNDQNPPYGNQPSVGLPRTGEFIVPNGTLVTGYLESNIDTKASQNNDRFKMTVQSPDEFRGAVVEGYITGVGRSGRVSGSSNITFNFDRITLRDGKIYDFAGSLQSIKDQNGKTVKVDTEGTAKGDSQTKETAKRGGIGAGAGAILGAIIGGGKGAVIGAVIGGGAGAGSVIAQGREDIQLLKGSMITVQSSSPIRDNPPRDN